MEKLKLDDKLIELDDYSMDLDQIENKDINLEDTIELDLKLDLDDTKELDKENYE